MLVTRSSHARFHYSAVGRCDKVV